MSWQIRILYRSRDDSLTDVAIAAGELAGEDGVVAPVLTETDWEQWWAEWSAEHVVELCGNGCELPHDSCRRHDREIEAEAAVERKRVAPLQTASFEC